ncbi:MAG: CBS domain-containing protein [Candidatus Woesearchaeota archaeon]
MEIKNIIKDDFLTVEKDQTLSSFIGRLRETDKRNALIFDHGKFEGILEEKWLLRAKMNASTVGISQFVKKIPTAAPDIDLVDAAYLMFQSDIDALPIAADKQISGIVYGLDLIKEAVKLGEMKGVKVSDLKLDKVQELKPKDPITKALEIMYQKKVRHIPVAEEGKVVGILSYRDILKKYYPFPSGREGGFTGGNKSKTKAFESDRPEIDLLPISSFDTHNNLHSCTEKDKLSEAVNLMCNKKVTSLLVIRDEKAVGLLSLKNILKKIASLKIKPLFNIQFVGLNDAHLNPAQKESLMKIAGNEAFKLQRRVNNEFNLVIHIKEYEKEGKSDKQHKYAINLKMEFPGQMIQSHKGWGGTWDIETAIRKAFENADNELKKKFKGDSSWRKSYE